MVYLVWITFTFPHPEYRNANEFFPLAFIQLNPHVSYQIFFFSFQMSQSLLLQIHCLDALQANYGNHKATPYLLSSMQKLEKHISVPAADLRKYKPLSGVNMPWPSSCSSANEQTHDHLRTPCQDKSQRPDSVSVLWLNFFVSRSTSTMDVGHEAGLASQPGRCVFVCVLGFKQGLSVVDVLYDLS